jgi:SAM-dependent methyltransferase
VTDRPAIFPDVPCALCAGTDAEIVGERDRDGAALRVVMCRACGLVWNDPRPGPEELLVYYRDAYRRDYKGTERPRPRHTARAARVATGRCARLARFLAPADVVLDLGAGSGELVYVLRRLGVEARGIEPNEGYAHFARDRLGAPVATGVWQHADIAPASLDAVTLFHVLEHLDAPVGALRLIREWLRPGGLLWIEVPNVESTCQAPSHRFHRAHLYGFNDTTLAEAGRLAGFSLEQAGASPDGGNLTTVLRRHDGPGAPARPLPDNAGRVRRRLGEHTALRHHLSATPYLRPVRKLAERLSETLAILRHPDPRDLLDAAIRAATASGALPPRARGRGATERVAVDPGVPPD